VSIDEPSRALTRSMNARITPVFLGMTGLYTGKKNYKIRIFVLFEINTKAGE
jgi:hypothetical protein